MQHADDVGDDVDALLGHLEPDIEGLDQLGAKVLAGKSRKVIKGAGDHSLLGRRPNLVGVV